MLVVFVSIVIGLILIEEASRSRALGATITREWARVTYTRVSRAKGLGCINVAGIQQILASFVTQACFFAEKFDPIIITSVPFYDIIAGISSAAIYIAVVQTFFG